MIDHAAHPDEYMNVLGALKHSPAARLSASESLWNVLGLLDFPLSTILALATQLSNLQLDFRTCSSMLEFDTHRFNSEKSIAESERLGWKSRQRCWLFIHVVMFSLALSLRCHA